MSDSPAVLLYDGSGNPLAVQDGVAVPANTSSLLMAGKDASGNARVPRVDSNGSQRTVLTSPNGPLAGLAAQITAYGYLRVTPESSSVFYDLFDGTTLDTDKWTATSYLNGTITAAQSSGEYTFTWSATPEASHWNKLTTKRSYHPYGLGFLAFGTAVKLEASILTNTHRFWGMGTSPAAPSTTTPLTDAIGFEIDTSGNLNAVVYKSGTKIYSQALNKPTDGEYHRYAIVYRTDTIIFYAAALAANSDSTEIPAASASFKLPADQSLPILVQAVNHSTAPSAGAVFKMTAVGIGDTGRNATALVDGIDSGRRGRLSKNIGAGLVATPQMAGRVGTTKNGEDTETGDLNVVSGIASGIITVASTTDTAVRSGTTYAAGSDGSGNISLSSSSSSDTAKLYVWYWTSGGVRKVVEVTLNGTNAVSVPNSSDCIFIEKVTVDREHSAAGTITVSQGVTLVSFPGADRRTFYGQCFASDKGVLVTGLRVSTSATSGYLQLRATGETSGSPSVNALQRLHAPIRVIAGQPTLSIRFDVPIYLKSTLNSFTGNPVWPEIIVAYWTSDSTTSTKVHVDLDWMIGGY